MTKKAPPTKITGGGGFIFEDKVAAYFLYCILSGRSPLDPKLGTISRIDFQTRSDGWLLDDILLTLISHGNRIRCAFSIKSNVQFTAKAAPSDFVKLAWEQYLNHKSSVFIKHQDRIGLITAPLGKKASINLNDILLKARLQDTKNLFSRIHRQEGFSIEKRSLFNSFACPPELAKKYGITDEEIGEFLKHFEHLEFDFETVNSSRLNEAILGLKDILVDADQDETIKFWNILCTVASEFKIGSGYLDLTKLLDRLRSDFKIKDHPDFRDDWVKLLEYSKGNLKLIQSKIANKIHLERESEKAELDKLIKKQKVVVLIGPSGCGKTVITKCWALKKLKSKKVLWLGAGIFSDSDVYDFKSKLHLKYSIKDVIKGVPDNISYIVIDGLDRLFSDSSFESISSIIQFCRLDNEKSPWKVIISCQPEEWGRIQVKLARVNLVTSDWEINNIKEPSYKELEPVWKVFPALRNFILQSQLKPLLFNPKILDLIATNLAIGKSVDTTSWVGESSVIDWFWKTEIEKSQNYLKRAQFIKFLAQKQADALEVETPQSDLPLSELDVAQSLIRDRICKKRDDRLSFEHDLYGDWARQRLLVEKSQTIVDFLKDRLFSPLWCRAFRLFGLYLLEKENDISKWKSTLDMFSSQENKNELAQDLLIESAVFASNPQFILDRLWPVLKANNSNFLRRLLGRFLYSATLPNPILLSIIKNQGEEISSEDATIERVPNWPYWLPILNFLHRHKLDVLNLAQFQVAVISDKWLRFSDVRWPMRKEAADMAISIAEEILAFKMSNGINIVKDKLDEIAFKAGLAAINEEEKRVAEFALTACSRIEPKGTILKRIIEFNKRYEKKVDISTSKPVSRQIFLNHLEEDVPSPWSDGPIKRVDSEFQKICLNSDAIHPVILSNPSLASEIILALLIKHPVPRYRFGDDLLLREDLSLKNIHKWFPPFYTHGPFLFFLRSHPIEGIRLILRLINFATERWIDRKKKNKRDVPSIHVSVNNREKWFTGDKNVFYWFRNISPVPDVIPSALMSLEKWLYNQADKKEGQNLLSEAIEVILNEASSLALIGILCSLGKKKPTLFLKELKPLLPIPEFYSWDFDYVVTGESHQMIGWTMRGKTIFKLAKDWNSLPHRSTDLSYVALHLFLNFPEIRSYLEKVKCKWDVRLKKGNFDSISPTFLENLTVWFNISYWKKVKDSEGTSLWKFNPPKKFINKRKKREIEIKDRGLLIHMPLRLRQTLDADKALPMNQVEELWSILKRIEKLKPKVEDKERFLDTKNVICGGAAVLLKLHSNWLKQDPKKEEWCVKQLVDTIQNPPEMGKFDSEYGLVNWNWDRFCAQVMPILWSENPNSPILRQCIALLAISPHYETIVFLFESASKLRSKLRKHFRQLQRFILRWAEARAKHYRSRFNEEIIFDVMHWIKKEVNAFSKGNISDEVPIWKQILMKKSKKDYVISTEEKQKKKARRKKKRRIPEIDFLLIKSAYDWVPSIDEAISEAEREDWITFWREALGWTISIIRGNINEKGEISGTPSDWDSWVLSRIASFSVQLKASKKPEDFWRPILDLGPSAHYWIDDFFDNFFMTGLGSKIHLSNFTSQWQAMLNYAFDSPKWMDSSGRGGFYLEENWWSLMGFRWSIVELWKSEFEPIIKNMTNIYECWAREHLCSPRSAVRFIRFLKQPAAKGILFDGLIWLDLALSEANDYFWNSSEDVKDKLANLLDKCWRSNEEQLRSQKKALKAFKSLLKKLIDFQNPLALEIQQSLVAE